MSQSASLTDVREGRREAEPAAACASVAGGDAAAGFAIRDGATDCHVHVFDPAHFPYAEPRSYTPSVADLADLTSLRTRLHMSRQVLVQPSVYGADNRCLVDALRHIGPRQARGIAVIDPVRATDEELSALKDAGVVGVRVNLNVKGEDRAPAAVRAVLETTDRVAEFGFIVQIYADMPLLDALAQTIADAPVPVLLDHFGGARAELGLDQPGFAALRRLLVAGAAWVKLSAPYRASHQAPPYADVAPLARALIAANPDRLVWASDWPHTGGGASRKALRSTDIEPFRDINDAAELGLLSGWAQDAATHHKILVENPARLFGFQDRNARASGHPQG